MFENSNGGVSVVYPAIKAKRDKETDLEFIERVFNKATPKAADYKDIDSSELPDNDRKFWVWNSGNIVIDTVKKEATQATILKDQQIKDKLIEIATAEINKGD